MITSNLKVILAQKNVTISQVHEATGISRSTLTLLCNNSSNGIQFDTLDSLCSFLDVLPNEIIIFSPFKVTVSADNMNNFIVCTVKNTITDRQFKIEFLIEKDNGLIWLVHFKEQEALFESFIKIIQELPTYYVSKLNDDFRGVILKLRWDEDIPFTVDKTFSILNRIY